MNSETTLGEKIRTIFREQGITVLAILTVISTIISNMILGITNALGISTNSTGGASKDSNKVVSLVSNKLSTR